MDQTKTDAPPQYTEVAPPPAGQGYGEPPNQQQQQGFPAYDPPPQQQGYGYPPQQQAYAPGTTYTAPGYGQPYPGRANMHAYQPLAAQQQSSTNVTVVNAQPSTIQYSVGVMPESYMGLSIFTCLCCCWLFGLIAIMYSSQVQTSWSVGDYEGARSSSRTALHWNIASIVFGIFGGILSGVSVGIYYATYDPDPYDY